MHSMRLARRFLFVTFLSAAVLPPVGAEDRKERRRGLSVSVPAQAKMRVATHSRDSDDLPRPSLMRRTPDSKRGNPYEPGAVEPGSKEKDGTVGGVSFLTEDGNDEDDIDSLTQTGDDDAYGDLGAPKADEDPSLPTDDGLGPKPRASGGDAEGMPEDTDSASSSDDASNEPPEEKAVPAVAKEQIDPDSDWMPKDASSDGGIGQKDDSNPKSSAAAADEDKSEGSPKESGAEKGDDGPSNDSEEVPKAGSDLSSDPTSQLKKPNMDDEADKSGDWEPPEPADPGNIGEPSGVEAETKRDPKESDTHDEDLPPSDSAATTSASHFSDASPSLLDSDPAGAQDDIDPDSGAATASASLSTAATGNARDQQKLKSEEDSLMKSIQASEGEEVGVNKGPQGQGDMTAGPAASSSTDDATNDEGKGDASQVDEGIPKLVPDDKSDPTPPPMIPMPAGVQEVLSSKDPGDDVDDMQSLVKEDAALTKQDMKEEEAAMKASKQGRDGNTAEERKQEAQQNADLERDEDGKDADEPPQSGGGKGSDADDDSEKESDKDTAADIADASKVDDKDGEELENLSDIESSPPSSKAKDESSDKAKDQSDNVPDPVIPINLDHEEKVKHKPDELSAEERAVTGRASLAERGNDQVLPGFSADGLFPPEGKSSASDSFVEEDQESESSDRQLDELNKQELQESAAPVDHPSHSLVSIGDMEAAAERGATGFALLQTREDDDDWGGEPEHKTDPGPASLASQETSESQSQMAKLMKQEESVDANELRQEDLELRGEQDVGAEERHADMLASLEIQRRIRALQERDQDTSRYVARDAAASLVKISSAPTDDDGQSDDEGNFTRSQKRDLAIEAREEALLDSKLDLDERNAGKDAALENQLEMQGLAARDAAIDRKRAQRDVNTVRSKGAPQRHPTQRAPSMPSKAAGMSSEEDEFARAGINVESQTGQDVGKVASSLSSEEQEVMRDRHRAAAQSRSENERLTEKLRAQEVDWSWGKDQGAPTKIRQNSPQQLDDSFAHHVERESPDDGMHALNQENLKRNEDVSSDDVDEGDGDGNGADDHSTRSDSHQVADERPTAGERPSAGHQAASGSDKRASEWMKRNLFSSKSLETGRSSTETSSEDDNSADEDSGSKDDEGSDAGDDSSASSDDDEEDAPDSNAEDDKVQDKKPQKAKESAPANNTQQSGSSTDPAPEGEPPKKRPAPKDEPSSSGSQDEDKVPQDKHKPGAHGSTHSSDEHHKASESDQPKVPLNSQEAGQGTNATRAAQAEEAEQAKERNKPDRKQADLTETKNSAELDGELDGALHTLAKLVNHKNKMAAQLNSTSAVDASADPLAALVASGTITAKDRERATADAGVFDVTESGVAKKATGVNMTAQKKQEADPFEQLAAIARPDPMSQLEGIDSASLADAQDMNAEVPVYPAWPLDN